MVTSIKKKSKKMRNLLIPMFGIIVLLTSCKRKGTTNPENSILKNRIESYLNKCDENGVSGSILIAQEGKILYSRGLGLSDRNKNISTTKETIFTIGSITKQFTATAILKLQEEGKLSVEDSISKFFPNINQDKKNITIHQLLTHTSGIIGNLNNGGDFVLIEKEDFLSQVINSPLDFYPGSKHKYSNVGYSVLAIILEKITQQSYEEYLQQTFFKKAGMANTGYLLPKWDKTKIARPYKCEEDNGTHLEKWKTTSNQVSYHLKGNGGILSTPSDLYKWYTALKENQIISKKSFDSLVYPHVITGKNSPYYYGYGWIISESKRNTKKVWHNGSNNINYASFIQLPEENNTVIIYMTNQLRHDTKGIGIEVEKLIFDENYQPIVPKMNSSKYAAGEEPNERMVIINKFVSILLKKNTEESIENFMKTNVPNIDKHKSFKMYFNDMQEEFTDYRLVHTLEYEDYTYDILLESKQGVIEQLTPCFDFKFNNQNKIIDFGW